jgi:hypothetical protein
VSHQLTLPLPYPAGWCEANRFNLDAWPQYITDPKGKRWLVLHVGGGEGKSQDASFCCHKPRTVEYHHIKDFEACPA